MAKPCLLYAASPLHDKALLERLRSAITPVAERHAGARDLGVASSPGEAAERLQGCGPAVIVFSTGGTEHIVLQAAAAATGPLLLVAHPYANSLPALLEAYPLLRRLGAAAAYVEELSPEVVERGLAPGLRGLLAASRLRGARLGIIGEPSPWLVYSRVEPAELRERLGVSLVEVPMESLEEEYRRAQAPEQLLEKLVSGAAGVERPREELEKALRLYAAMKRIVERERLDAVTIECFEVIPRLDTTACLALSLLNSEGVVAGCEGDVPAALTMMLASWAAGRPAFMANLARLYSDGVLLAHCTAPLSEGRYRLLSHYETGKGVGVSLEYPRGSQATIARLSPGLDSLRLGIGEVVESGLLSPLHCRTQVRLKTSWDPYMLLERSTGNHYVLVLGNHVQELKTAAQMLGIEPEILS